MSGRSPSPQRRNRPDFEVQTPGKKLVQEITDEFLVCKICLEGYKTPKSLNCLHTFCEDCIENHVMSESTYKKYSDYREFTCPLCRKRTNLPIGGVKKLPDNFLVSSLTEIVGRQKPSKFPFCDICKMINKRHKEATSKCLDCAKLLCSGCVTMHKDTKVTKNHSIFDVEIEKDIECKEHVDEVVRFYCEVCETCICVICTFNEHKDHEITQFKEAVAKYKENIQGLLKSCESKISLFDNHLEALNTCEDNIKEAEEKIHNTASQYITEIRNREKQLTEELQNMYGAELMKQIENKKNLSAQVDGLRSTCNLTEVILKGKDIELLLLKKDVQEKLNVLNDVEIKEPPPTVTKRVTFESGQIDLGYIHDQDRPLLSKMRFQKGNGGSKSDDDYPEVFDRMTQTDINKSISKGRGRGRKYLSKSKHSDSEDDSESGTDLETEDETDDETDDEKPELVDSGVQTEQKETSDSSSGSDADESGPDVTDDSTMTDKVRIRMRELGVYY